MHADIHDPASRRTSVESHHWETLKHIGGTEHVPHELSELAYQRRVAPLFKKRREGFEAKVEALVQQQLAWEKQHGSDGIEPSS